METGKKQKKALINSLAWGIIGLYLKIRVAIFELRKIVMVRRANYLSKLTGYKYIIILFAGSLKLYKRKDLKRALSMRVRGVRVFKKGTDIRDIEKHAIYITQ